MASLREDLRKLRKYLSKSSNWTKHAAYRDKEGKPTRRTEATCACLLGAIAIVSDGRGRPENNDRFNGMYDVLAAIRPEGYVSLPAFNDDPATKHEDVLDLLDKAIEKSA